MDIEGLMRTLDDERKAQLRALIRVKADVGEKQLYQRDENLDAWVESLFAMAEESQSDLGVNNSDIELLDTFFLKIINASAHV